MSYLFFDTETTGLPDHNRAPDDKGQPNICQLGAILTDDVGLVKAEMNFLITPEGWEIPLKLTEIHGISQEAATLYGISIKGALSLFSRMISRADHLVAHNIKFDIFMLEIECARSGVVFPFPTSLLCTMESSSEILKIPPTARMLAYDIKGYKNPNLQEAHHFFKGIKFEGAHDAMADVRACKDVFFSILKHRKKEEQS